MSGPGETLELKDGPVSARLVPSMADSLASPEQETSCRFMDNVKETLMLAQRR